MHAARLPVLFALACLLLAACGGGGGGTLPAAVDLTGYWQLYLTPAGFQEIGPSCVYLSQTGSLVDGAAINGTVSGNVVVLSSTATSIQTAFAGTATSTAVNGTFAITGAVTVNGSFRLVKFTPTGTVAISGTVGSTAVDLDLATGVGSRDFSDQAKTVLEEVELVAAIGSEHLELDFTPAGLTVGVLAVPGDVAATVTYRNDATDVELDGSGTLTLTRYDGSGFAGSFTLTLTGGGTLTGSFDVSWDIASYEP